jgi:PAS domain S-box-containing protein
MITQKELNSWLFVAMRYLPDSAYLKDLFGRFLWVNEAKAKNSNTTTEAMVGKTDFDFLPHDEAQRIWESESVLVETGVPIQDEVEELTRADGNRHWKSVTRNLIQDENGKVIGIFGVSRDVTAQKIAENHNIAVTKMLKHDLINKTMAMSLTVRLLSSKKGKGYTNPELAFQKLKKKILGVEKIVKRCVLVGDKPSKTITVDLADLVESVLDESIDDLIEKNISIDNDQGGIPQDEIEIEASDVLISVISSAISNFTENSLRYGGENFTIAVGREKHENDVRIIFYTSGTPVPEETVKRIFEQGYTSGKGSGMGLFLIKKLIQNLGGDVWHEYTWDGHSQFVIKIPLMAQGSE